jgi:hypothetical protein
MVHHSTLRRIMDNLTEIKSQNRWLLIFFRDLNKSKVDDSLNHLATALEKFKVCLLLSGCQHTSLMFRD